MKRYFSLVFACWATLHLTAQQQSWDLFPLGQKTWWRVGDSLQVLYNDSTETSTDGGRLHHFGYRYLAAPFGQEDCFFNLFVVDPKEDYFPLPQSYWLDLFSKPDGSWYETIQEPIFFSKTPPGAHWIFRARSAAGDVDNIRITCTALDTLQLWGHASAVKRFRVEPLSFGGAVLTGHPLYGFEYLLSEQFGLLRFIPLHFLAQGLATPVYEMIGLENKGLQLGQAFDFEDFMGRYHSGDLYKWHYRSVNYPQGIDIQEWRRDSVFSVQVSVDTGAYIAKRQVLRVRTTKANGQISSDSTTFTLDRFRQTFARTLYEPILQAVPKWYARHIYSSLLRTEGFFEADGTLTLSADLGSWAFDQNACAFLAVADGDYKVGVNTVCGMSYSDRWGQSGYYREQLLGCRRDSTVWGNVGPLPTVSTAQPVLRVTLSVWPNPVQGELYVELPEPFNREKTLLLALSDISGRLLRSDPAYQSGKRVDLSGLPAGIYLVRVRGKGLVAQRRVFKAAF